MDDVMGRITDILKDEESLRQLSELAEMLKSESASDTSSVHETCDEPRNTESSGDMSDMAMMLKLTSLAGAMNSSDKNTELLLALRPHLGAAAQQRLDRAVKLLKLLAVYEAAKESGMLNNLL